MRTLNLLLIGFCLWGALLGAARVFADASPASTTAATAAFAGLWLAATAANLWVGVTRAGYSLKEELPIFLLLFLVPVVTAAAVKWKLL